MDLKLKFFRDRLPSPFFKMIIRYPFNTPIEIIQQTTGSIIWQNNGDCEPLHITTQAKMECDGYINYSIQITADSDCAITDVRLEIPYSKLIAQYMMGMGQKGGYRPQKISLEMGYKFCK